MNIERFLYRGKRLDNGEWVIGSLVMNHSSHSICKPSTSQAGARKFFKVDPATIGQCTGLKDRHGKLIFDGDLCKGEYREIEVDKDGKPYEGDNVCTYIEVVRYCVDQGGYMLTTGNDGEMSVLDINAAARVEVVGNVHDNADLLEVQS